MIGISTQDDTHATDLTIAGNTSEQGSLHKSTINESILAETNANETVQKDKTEDDNCIKYTAKDYLTESDVGIITEFIQTKLLHKKHMFARCYFMKTRHFEERTTNPVEQQNSANKVGHRKVKPSLNLEKSARKMNMKSRATHVEKDVQYCINVDKSSLWSKSSTAKEIIKNIEGVITQFWIMRKQYHIIQVKKSQFWVLSKLYSASDSCITKFERVRIINIGDKYMECSCCCFEQNGYPCTHIMLFLSEMLPRMMILRYRRDYYHFFGNNIAFTKIYNTIHDDLNNKFCHFSCIDVDQIGLTYGINKNQMYPRTNVPDGKKLLTYFLQRCSKEMKRENNYMDKQECLHQGSEDNFVTTDLEIDLDEPVDYSGMCSQVSTSTQAKLMQLSQEVGVNDVMDISNSASIKKVKRKNPERIYSENNAVLKQTCNIIDTDSILCDEFHEEFVTLSNKYIKLMKNKHAKKELDQNTVSSHNVLDRREICRRYKPL